LTVVAFTLVIVKTQLDKRQKFAIQAESIKLDEEMGAINQQQNTKEGEISSLVPLNAIQSCTPGVIQDTNKSVEMMH